MTRLHLGIICRGSIIPDDCEMFVFPAIPYLSRFSREYHGQLSRMPFENLQIFQKQICFNQGLFGFVQ